MSGQQIIPAIFPDNFYWPLVGIFGFNKPIFFTVIIIPVILLVLLRITKRDVFLKKLTIIIAILNSLYFYISVDVVFEFH